MQLPSKTPNTVGCVPPQPTFYLFTGFSDSEHDAIAANARRLIAKFRGTRLGQLLGFRQSTVGHWANTGPIPGKWQQRTLDMAVERGISVSPAEFAVVRRKKKLSASSLW